MAVAAREGQDEGGLKSVAAALDLLDCFVEDEELGVSEVARRLGVAKSTAHRLLTTLASRGLIAKSDTTGRYRLGLHLVELGQLAVDRTRLRQVSVTMLEEMRERTGWTVHLGVPAGTDVLYLERFATLRGMRAMTQYRRRWPLHATSSGKAMCAFDPALAQARIVAGLPGYTPATVTDPVVFRRQLIEIRSRGYATSHEELMPHLSSVAAPVLDRSGRAIAAVSITGSEAELGAQLDGQARLVVLAARRISAAAMGAAKG